MLESSVERNLVPNSSQKPSQGKNYLLLGILANGLLWLLALIYLKFKPPAYTSEWALIILGNESSTRVELPGIGRADAESESPFQESRPDPRENYKFIAQSEEVLAVAANKMNLSPEEFSKPRIDIIDNTNLVQFTIKGRTAQQAQEKALALNQALETKLTQLRTSELAQQDSSLQNVLTSSQQNLLKAQQSLSQYKSSSGLSTVEQLQDLAANIEQLRKQRAETVAQLQQTTANLQQLSANLGLSAGQAASSLVLSSDELFQQYLGDYTEATAKLTSLSSRLLPNHPDVVATQNQRDIAQAALLQRGQSLLGQPVNQATLELPNLGGESNSESGLFQQLIALQSQQQGLFSKAQELGLQIQQLEQRLKALAQEESTLDGLRRNVQIAEAVFSSTLAKLDLSQSSALSSYPLTQVVTEPTLPFKPSSPRLELVLLGTAFGSILITIGIVLLWWREKNAERLDKIVSSTSE